MTIEADAGPPPSRVPFYNDPKIRGIAYQVLLFAFILWLGYEFWINARDNLRASKIQTGFGFLDNTAGFDINQTLIPYTESDSYGRAFLVGLLNTLLVAILGIFSPPSSASWSASRGCRKNWLLQKLAGGLCRADPQPAAAAPDPVLVSRRARLAAGAAPEHLDLRRGLSQQPRASSCRGRFSRTAPASWWRSSSSASSPAS